MDEELIHAIADALAGKWDSAHRIVQNIENETAYWIHAVLHKIEGDEDNSGYWYSRAGKQDHFGMDSAAELEVIRKELSGKQR